MTKYLIFDFDGVLSNSAEADINLMVTSDNYPDITDHKAAKHHRAHVWASKPPDTHTHTELHPDIYALYKEAGDHYVMSKVELFQDMIEEIKKIRDVKLAIVSSGPEHYIKKTLEQTDLQFEYVYGIETSPSKVTKVKKVCDSWGIDPQDAWYFTDTQADIIELQDLMGLKKLIGCAWGWQGYDYLRELLPSDQILEEAFEMHRVIDNQDARGEEKHNKNTAKKIVKAANYEKERVRRLKVQEQKNNAISKFMEEENQEVHDKDSMGQETFKLFKDDKRSLTDFKPEAEDNYQAALDDQKDFNSLDEFRNLDEGEDFESIDEREYVDFPTTIIQPKKYVLLDSTGIRRPGQRTFGAESFATFRTIEEAYNADVICMVVDGSKPLAHQDQVVAGIVKEARKGVVVIVNKGDLVDEEGRFKFQAEFEHKFAFLKIKKFVWVSAKTGEGVKSIWDNVDMALDERNLDISRDELRKLFNYLMKRKPPKKLRLEKRPIVYDLLYDNTKTPTFELLVKSKQTIHWSYLRFLENTIRANFGFENTEIKVKAVNVSRKKVMG